MEIANMLDDAETEMFNSVFQKADLEMLRSDGHPVSGGFALFGKDRSLVKLYIPEFSSESRRLIQVFECLLA
jgi:hypothetical protein